MENWWLGLNSLVTMSLVHDIITKAVYWKLKKLGLGGAMEPSDLVPACNLFRGLGREQEWSKARKLECLQKYFVSGRGKTAAKALRVADVHCVLEKLNMLTEVVDEYTCSNNKVQCNQNGLLILLTASFSSKTCQPSFYNQE